ncbi:MAG: cytochrome b N-terminal domain-containing protein [Deltaproteobacteria bacterium]|nr:cytochrome b N-terminal domain-containing protein [Deltaproteobacteria bacterium]
MKKPDIKIPKRTFIEHLQDSFRPEKLPTDDRGRMRMVLDNLIFHIHPPKIPERTLRWTYTWGLGGISAVLFGVLVVTGLLLEMNYTPSPPQAYLDVIDLRTDIWFGDLIRNLHHWSGNFMVVVVTLHLLRVFFTGSYRPPRQFNWIIGMAMLLLVLAANFTGYLLPWDQLAFWAITVGTSLISYIPVAGPFISRMLLGGPEVGSQTLLSFYSMHISFIPIALVMLMSFHSWKIRKDGGGLSIPKGLEEGEMTEVKKVTTIPHLVRRELVCTVTVLAILFVWSALVSAPLEGIANPDVSPNPAKAPWYFMGLQELLLHFHPLIGAIIIPGIALVALLLLPFYDSDDQSTGIYFRSRKGRYMTIMAVVWAVVLVPLWIILDEFVFFWTEWLPGWSPLISNGLIPLGIVLLALFILDRVSKHWLDSNYEERILTLFSFLFVSLVILTIIGIFFRGPGMNLYWPWNMPSAHPV